MLAMGAGALGLGAVATGMMNNQQFGNHVQQHQGAYEQVYNSSNRHHHGSLSHELIAGAVSFAGELREGVRESIEFIPRSLTRLLDFKL